MIFNKILEKKKTVLIIFVAFLIIGIVIGLVCKKEKYVASSIILLKSNDAKYSLTTGMFNTYKQIIKNDETYKEVEKVTGLGINYKDLSKSISISRENNSNTMNIKVKRYSEDESLKLLNAIINNFSEKLPEIYENEEVVIIDPSHISQKVSDANFLLAIPLSITCGMIISVIYVAVHLSIDKKQNILKDLERETLLKPLASIPFNKTKSNTLMSLESKTQKCFVPFDDLKTAIQFINFNKDSKKSVLVTSLLDGEGKSYVAANLAISYALAGKKVILIDADMDLGTQSSLFNVPNNLGFSNYLSNLNEEGIETEELLNKYIKETSIKNLNIITSGTVPPNSQELLFSDKITKLIKDLSIFFDIIIVDGKNISNKIDSLVLTRSIDSTIIVSASKKTMIEDLTTARKDILNVGGNVIGIVLNKAKSEKNYLLAIKQKLSKVKERISKLFAKKTIPALPEAVEGREYLTPIVEKIVTENVAEPEKIVEIEKEEIKEPEKEIPTEEPIILDETSSETPEEIAVEKIEEEKKKIPFKEILTEKITTIKNKFIKEEKVKPIEELEQTSQTDEETNEEKYEFEMVGYKPLDGKQEEITIKHDETKIDGQISLLESEKESEKEEIKEPVKEEPKEIEETTKQEETEDSIEYNQMPLEKYLSDENTILVVVDIENAYCRLFGANAFMEKPIYSISADSKGNKPYYNKRFVRKIQNRIKNTYGINDDQIKRIDILVYSILREYDDSLWTDKRIESHRAEAYVQIMSKDYDRIAGESDEEYLIRSKRIRILTLAKSNIDIEYLTDNMWKFNKLKILDKLSIIRYIKEFEIDDYLKSDFEIQKTKQNVEFYNNIYKATNEFNKHEPKHEQEIIKEDFIKEETPLNELDKEEQKMMKKFKKEKARIDRIEKRKERLEIAREKRNKRKAERIKSQQLLKEQREFEKERQREEARIEEELLTDNLYPKTKFNKNL